MTMLDTKTELPRLEQAETANGPFFVGAEARLLSEDFWLENQKLLADGFGAVIQTGVSGDGEWVDIDSKWSIRTTTLAFDARRRDEGVFTWQLVEAFPEKGRIITSVHVNFEDISTEIFVLDAQGKLEAQTTYADPSVVLSEIMFALNHHATREKITNLELRQSEAEAGLASYEAEYKDFGEAKRIEKMDKERARIKGIGFVALDLYQPAAGSTPFNYQRVLHGLSLGEMSAQPKVT